MVKKTIEIDVNSSNAEKNVSKLSGNLNNLGDAAIKVKEASKELGIINEGTAETLGNVQTIAETSASTYRTFSGVLKSFGIVQKITTAAQYVWNAAMAANPIGAIVAVVVALIAAGYALVKMFQASSAAAQLAAEANKRLNKELQTQIELQRKATIESELSRDSQLKMAKASGQSSKEIRKLAEELANQEVKQKIANTETLRAIALEAKRVASLEDATDAQKETAKVSLKAFQDAYKDAESAILNRRKLAIENRVAERQEQTDANKKLQEEEVKHQKEIQDKRDAAREIQRKKDEADLRIFREFLAQKRQIELDSLNNSRDAIDKATEENINRTLSQNEVELRAIGDKYFTLIELAKQNGLDILELEIAQANEINDVNLRLEKSKRDEANKTAEQKKILQQQEIQAASDTFGILADLLGKQSKAGKAFAVAQALINTYQGITAGVKLGYPAAIPAVLAASVTGFKAVKDILKTDPKAGGGGASASSGGGAPTATPQFNLVGQSSTNQLAQTISNQQQQPIKTYVVAGDVTTAQGLDRSAVQTSTFGG